MRLFAAAIFLGAFLLFLVQPLIGRFLLPWFGGSPGIWTVCLLFFQTALFAGYLYAHLLTRIASPRRQIVIHLGLVAGALLTLPPIPRAPEIALAAEQPIQELIGLLITSIGVLFVLLAATGPLIQRWFHACFPDKSPYPLYALSNFGSLLALVAYPLILEPWLSRQEQAIGWSTAFVLFSFLLVGCWSAIRKNTASQRSPVPPELAHPRSGVTWMMRLRWLLRAGIGTGMLAATTANISADVAPVPFLWLTPIAIYLATFIATFSRRSWYRPVPLAALIMIGAVLSADLREIGTQVTFYYFLSVSLLGLGVVGLLCHGELYRTRPAGIHLTDFYLTISAGGALGTLWVAIVSPALTHFDWDLPLLWLLTIGLSVAIIARGKNIRSAWALLGGLLAAVVINPVLRSFSTGTSPWHPNGMEWAEQTEELAMLLAGIVILIFYWSRNRLRRWSATAGGLALAMPLLFGINYFGSSFAIEAGTVARIRGFHGLITVVDRTGPDPRSHARFMNHGTTAHGLQFTHADFRWYPTSYYTPESGIGRALSRRNQRPARKIGVVGLGIGTIAAYGMEGDLMRFFEIDPHVIEIAQTDFDFLAGSGAQIEIVLGDGRLALAHEASNAVDFQYDLLVLDAFSGDAVPVHLLTKEAFAIYRQRLSPSGLLAINISNRILDLRRAIEGNVADAGFHLAHIIHHPETDEWWRFPSEWLLVAPRRETLDTPRITEWTGIAAPEQLQQTGWTDESASLLSVLR
ncbi:MAG: fused MFS/spermidine synthase [Synoicihabitans sp.]